MGRESGYYWVKNENIWYVAKYNKDYFAWSISGVETTFTDVDFEEIDERRIVREETPDEIDYSCGSCSNSPCTCQD